MAAKAIYDHTEKSILVVCFTNHALDQFLEDLLDIGIPNCEMVRLGNIGKAPPRLQSLGIFELASSSRISNAAWSSIQASKEMANHLANQLHSSFSRYRNATVSKAHIMDYLEFLPGDIDFHDAFTIPESSDGTRLVGRRGRSVDSHYLLDQWCSGRDQGVLSSQMHNEPSNIWRMPNNRRQELLHSWKSAILEERVAEITSLAQKYDQAQAELAQAFRSKNSEIIKNRRFIGCTTTAAAKYSLELQAASRDVVLVEEAGEILESHILTALGPKTDQLILIGDHKQLRPKVANYDLSVEKGDGYDLNRSLFERLVLKGFPHQILTQQHRMRPEISSLVRSLTYPDLLDAPKTKERANIRGLQNNIIFVNHDHPEDDSKETVNWKEMTSMSSKRNVFEAEMVLKSVRYLAQQGYGSDRIVVLTPYLGQLHLLRDVLSKDNDPILNDLDAGDLVRAGLVSAVAAQQSKKKLRLATIDNYQGEESDIVVATLTRSNQTRDIGFMSAPERLNVLLSRARDGLIMIGNAATFSKARKGSAIWVQLFEMLKTGGNFYNGLPVKCEQHPNTKAILREVVDFENECPDGGCKEPWYSRSAQQFFNY